MYTKNTNQNRQDGGLWRSITDNFTEIGKRQGFNDYELAEDEDFKSLTVTNNLERTYPWNVSNAKNDRQSGDKWCNGR